PPPAPEEVHRDRSAQENGRLLGHERRGEESPGSGEQPIVAGAPDVPFPQPMPEEEREEQAGHVEDLRLDPEDVAEGRGGEEEARQEETRRTRLVLEEPPGREEHGEPQGHVEDHQPLDAEHGIEGQGRQRVGVRLAVIHGLAAVPGEQDQPVGSLVPDLVGAQQVPVVVLEIVVVPEALRDHEVRRLVGHRPRREMDLVDRPGETEKDEGQADGVEGAEAHVGGWQDTTRSRMAERTSGRLRAPMETTAAPRLRVPALVQHALAALAYLGLSLYYLRPIWRVFRDHIAPDPGDPWLVLTVLKWGMHQMRLGMPDFWNLPFFFPARGVTTYSDSLLGPAAFGTLLTSLFPGVTAVAVYNLLFLSSFVLCAWGTWYVLRRSGTGAAAAFLGGCIFAFSSYRWDQTSHAQMLLMGLIPLTLWTWDRLLEAPSLRRAALFLLFFLLHETGGSYLAYMILFPMAVMLAVRAPGLLRR